MTNRRKRKELYVLLSTVAATVMLYVVPYGYWVAYPLMLLSTLAHELGHGIAGVLVGGSFDQFELFADGSGLAKIQGVSGRFASAVVSAGGLVGPAIASAGGFMLARTAKSSRFALLGFSVFLLLAEILVVRNVFGFAFVAVVMVGAFLIAMKAPPYVSQFTLVFLSVQLALSVFSRGDYLFTEFANTGAGKKPSDVAQMADALFLPYWFWGAVCGLFSVVVLGAGLWSYGKTALRR